MEDFENQLIGQIVASDYRSSRIFQEFGIDYCFDGDMTVYEACRRNGIKLDKLIAELAKLRLCGEAENRFNHWPLGSLVDYIVDRCHKDTLEKLNEMKFYAEKVNDMHGRDHGELLDVYQELLILRTGMKTHIEDEEERLFPAIRKLTRANGSVESDRIDSVDIFDMMQSDHKEVRSSMKRIRKASGNYDLMGHTSTIYRALFGNLAMFERNLRKCLHLENNILFPKALKLL